MIWSSSRVFVTGASGFLGRYVVDALVSRSAAVVAMTRGSATVNRLNRPGVPEVTVDLRDNSYVKWLLEDERIDTVLHLAAQVKPADPVTFWETNVRGTWNLLEACRPTVRRIVLVSSIRAEEPERRDPYAVSKRCADLIADCYRDTLGLPLRVVALPPLYGPDGQWAQPLVGESWKWMDVRDAAAMVLRAAELIAVPEPAA